MAHYSGLYWGRGLWKALHFMALAYPYANPTVQERAAVRAIFENLVFTLPCAICRAHWSHFLAGHPIPTDTRDELIDFSVAAHNHVNRLLGKPEWTRAQFDEHYAQLLHAPLTDEQESALALRAVQQRLTDNDETTQRTVAAHTQLVDAHAAHTQQYAAHTQRHADQVRTLLVAVVVLSVLLGCVLAVGLATTIVARRPVRRT